MSVKRRDLIKHLEENGFTLLREGKKHSIYTNGDKRSPSSGIESSIVSLRIRSANKRECIRNSEILCNERR